MARSKDDFDEVPPERRAELHKRAQEVMRESRTAKEAKRRLPRLTSVMGAKRCSICKMPFPPDAPPSLDEAFAEHVLRAHQPGQTSEDFSQAAFRTVKEATDKV